MKSRNWADQPGAMRTRGGVRITARPGNAALIGSSDVILVIFGIEVKLTGDESHQLRDVLQAAELDAAAGNVIT
jgi:hypothetical protein